jgi:hypothetical protein
MLFRQSNQFSIQSTPELTAPEFKGTNLQESGYEDTVMESLIDTDCQRR